jgi:hypothetical protein
MAQWTPDPDDPVGPNEVLGRRLFVQRKLKGALDQPAFGAPLLGHFLEERDGGEVSLDRAGKTGSADKRVVRFLLPLCVEAGSKRVPPQSFEGWASIVAKRLTPKLPDVDFTLQALQEDGNPYHALVVPKPPCSPYVFALHLAHQFQCYGEQMKRPDCESVPALGAPGSAAVPAATPPAPAPTPAAATASAVASPNGHLRQLSALLKSILSKLGW